MILNVQRQPGANTINVVKSIKKLLPQLEANLPAAIDVTTLTDLTTAIQASVRDVEFELMLTVGLVVLVIFLFLRNLYGDHYSQRGGAAVAGGHVWRDVCAGLQPGQPVADGADDFDRVSWSMTRS